MKKLVILFSLMLACMLNAEKVENKQSSSDKDIPVVSEEKAIKVDSAVEKRRAEIKERLEKNKVNHSIKNSSPERLAKIAAMKEQQKKTHAARMNVIKVENDIATRKAEIIKTNEKATELAKEISDLEAKLKEKQAEVENIVAADEEYIKLVEKKAEAEKKLSEETNKTVDMVRQNMKSRFQLQTEAQEEAAPVENQAK